MGNNQDDSSILNSMKLERTEILELLESIYLFKKANDEQINLAIELFQVMKFNREEIIFSQGKPAANLYLVVSGQVDVFHYGNQRLTQTGTLTRGDIFGFEMLEFESKCLTSAIAASDVVVLWLDRERTRELLLNIPTFNLDLKILFESYLLSLKVRLPWKDPQEVVTFISRRHPVHFILRLIPIALWALISLSVIGVLVFRLPGLLTPLIILGVDLLFLSIWTIWMYVDWINDYSILTNRRLVYQEKVVMLYDSRQETPLNAILSTANETNWMGRQLSFGDVIVRTYAGQIILPKVSHPRQVSALIEVQAARAKLGMEEKEREKIEGLIREKIGLSEPQDVNKEQPVSAVLKSGKLLDFFSTLFRLRYEQGDVIVHRTHWFILLKRVWLPSLLMLGLLALLILRVFSVYSILSVQAVFGVVILLSIMIGLWWVYNFIDWRNDHYVITADQIVDVNKKPLGREERRAAPLKNVLSIEFERLGLIGLLLNFGTVYIRVGETTLTFDYVFNPAEVQRELFNRLAARDYKEKLEERATADKNVSEWIEAYHRVIESEKQGPNSNPVDSI